MSNMGRPRADPEHSRLPKYVYFKRGVYVYLDKERNSQYIIGRTEKEALKNYSRIRGTRDRSTIVSWSIDLIRTVRKNAKPRGLYVAIDQEWILDQFDKNNARCSVSGVWFSFDTEGKYKRRPWVPSVDRIDSSKPYTPENCRLVCSAANYAMNEWDDDVLLRLAQGVVKTLK